MPVSSRNGNPRYPDPGAELATVKALLRLGAGTLRYPPPRFYYTNLNLKEKRHASAYPRVIV
jgi:hypothetical protein